MNGPAELVTGQVVHERLRPVSHRFAHPLFWVQLDLARLDELPTASGGWFGVDRFRPLSLRRRDHGPRDGTDLLPWIRGVLRDAGLPDDGAVHLQCFPRVFGFVFNPVSFWHCHDAAGRLRAVLAEVNNTFGEHHGYLVTAPDGGPLEGATPVCRKVLHVSPFCRVEGGYRFRFRHTADHRFVGVDLFDASGPLIRTAIGGTAHPFTAATLRRALSRQPALTVGVVARILWHALRLWLKRVPVHTKPSPPSVALTVGSPRQETHP